MTYYVVALHTAPNFYDYHTLVAHGHSPELCAERLGISTSGDEIDGYVWCDGHEWQACDCRQGYINGHFDFWPKRIYAYYPCDDDVGDFLMYLDRTNVAFDSLEYITKDCAIILDRGRVTFQSPDVLVETVCFKLSPKIYAWMDAYHLTSNVTYSDLLEKLIEDHVITGNAVHATQRIQLIQRITASIIRAEVPALKRMLNWMITDLKHSNEENIVADVERTYNAVCNVYPELVEQETETN